MLKTSTPLAAHVIPAPGFIEAHTALAYATNAALSHPDKTGDLAYLPKTKEEAMDFQAHPWIIAAIIAAMRGVQEGTAPVVGEPSVVYTPTPAISDHLALVSEGRDLGLISASRINGTGGTRVLEPYATAAMTVLDEAVRDGYLQRPVRLSDIKTEG